MIKDKIIIVKTSNINSKYFIHESTSHNVKREKKVPKISESINKVITWDLKILTNKKSPD